MPCVNTQKLLTGPGADEETRIFHPLDRILGVCYNCGITQFIIEDGPESGTSDEQYLHEVCCPICQNRTLEDKVLILGQDPFLGICVYCDKVVQMIGDKDGNIYCPRCQAVRASFLIVDEVIDCDQILFKYYRERRLSSRSEDRTIKTPNIETLEKFSGKVPCPSCNCHDDNIVYDYHLNGRSEMIIRLFCWNCRKDSSVLYPSCSICHRVLIDPTVECHGQRGGLLRFKNRPISFPPEKQSRILHSSTVYVKPKKVYRPLIVYKEF